MPDIKVVVFGRGNGESILVEAENKHWIVVDSFINPISKEPAALTYLRELGLDPSEVLKTIIITHFHEDHIRGMTEIIQKAHPKASICLPDALTTCEALSYYVALDVLNGYDSISKVKEMISVLEYLDKNQRYPIRINQNKLIFENNNHVITALSPSDYDSYLANKKFMAEVANTPKCFFSASKENPNHFCIAISIQNKNSGKCILLGGDLEVCDNDNSGWTSALSSIKAPSQQSIEVFKVPHHGSDTAYHIDTWENYVIKDALAILTTFSSSALPREEYIEIFKKYTTSLFCTTKPKYALKQVLSHKSQKILATKNIAITITDVLPKNSFGFVEATHSSGNFSCKLSGDAVKL